jgi:hypothetical protein
MKVIFFSVILLAVLTLAVSCSSGPGSSISSNNSSNLKLKMNVKSTGNLKMGLKSQILKSLMKGIGTGLTNGMDVSFNATSIKIIVTGLYLYQGNMTNKTKTLNFLCPTGFLELVGSTTLVDVFSSTATLSENDFGTYNGIDFIFGNLQNDTPYMLVSGNFTINGVTYTFTNLPVSGTQGGDLVFRNPVTISSNNIPVVGAVIDIDNAFNIYYYDYAQTNGGTSIFTTNVPGYSSNIVVYQNNPTILPFAGTNTPTLERYQLVLSNTNWGAGYTIGMTVIKNGTDIYAVNCRYYFDTNFLAIDSMEPPNMPIYIGPECFWHQLITNNVDGSYWIEDTTPMPPSTTLMTFPAFRLENHTNIVIQNSTSWVYYCTKE